MQPNSHAKTRASRTPVEAFLASDPSLIAFVDTRASFPFSSSETAAEDACRVVGRGTRVVKRDSRDPLLLLQNSTQVSRRQTTTSTAGEAFASLATSPSFSLSLSLLREAQQPS